MLCWITRGRGSWSLGCARSLEEEGACWSLGCAGSLEEEGAGRYTVLDH